MRTAVIDVESFWDVGHTLSKMSPIEYVMHPDTEIISIAIKFNDYPTDVFFGEDKIRQVLGKLDWSDTMVIGHNCSAFDSMILAWRFGLKPKMWGCTLAMARPIHAKTVGLSLGKLVAHYGIGVKDNTALVQTKGKHLADFTESEIEAMKGYNREDTEQCYALFKKLKPHYTAKELWHIDASIRMLVDAQFEVDVPMLETALSIERDQKRKHILMVAKKLRTTPGFESSAAVMEAATIETLEEAVRAELASAPKFAALLGACGVEVPMKPSPSNPEKQVPALAKSDEAFVSMQEHDDPIVAAAARARLAVKSTMLETRIEKFLEAQARCGGKLPIPTHYCGADTTGRRSGWGYNPLNLSRVGPTPKTSDALRNSMRAPKGYKVVVADLSGIEMRFNHTLWKVPKSMALWQESLTADLYKATASEMYSVPEAEVTKAQRQYAKVLHLACGYGMGPAKFRDAARLMGGLTLTPEQSAEGVAQWRALHLEIVKGWRTCHSALQYIHDEQEVQIDPWGLFTTCSEGIRLPSGRIIRYPGLHQEEGPDGKKEWWYGQGRHRARIYAGKITENLCQAGSRDVMYDILLDVFKATGFRPALEVYDEGVWIVPDSEAQGVLDAAQKRMRTPPAWWPQLLTYSEGDIAQTYGAAK